MTNQLQKIPSLRFLDKNGDKFPEWIMLRLSDFGKASMCKRIFKDETSEAGDIPFFKIGTFGKKPDAFISREKYEDFKEKYSFPKVGDILLSASGTIGRQVVYDGKPAYFQDSNIIWLEHDESKISNSFLGHIYANTNWITDGNTIDRLYNKNFLNTKVVIPCIDEQKKIASFLSSADNWIENLKKQKASLEEYKKGMMQKIFSRDIRFRDEDGSEYPEWEEKKLKEIGKFTSGQGFSQNEQGGSEGVPFYKVSDMNSVGNEKTMTVAHHYVSNDQIRRNKYKVIDKASVIFAKVGAAIFLERKRIAKKFLIDNNMMSFTPTIDFNFSYYLLNKIRLSKFSQIGALPSYNSSDIGIIKITIPKSIDEQQRIATFLSSIDQQIKSKETQIKKAKEWKKGLLQQMFV